MIFIPDKLKECRLEQKLTLTDLMFALEKKGLRVSRQTLLNWESGVFTPNVNNLCTLASFFKKPYEYFFTQKLN